MKDNKNNKNHNNKNIKIMNLMTAHLFHTRKMKSLIAMEAQDMDMNKIAVTYKKL